VIAGRSSCYIWPSNWWTADDGGHNWWLLGFKEGIGDWDFTVWTQNTIASSFLFCHYLSTFAIIKSSIFS